MALSGHGFFKSKLCNGKIHQSDCVVDESVEALDLTKNWLQ